MQVASWKLLVSPMNFQAFLGQFLVHAVDLPTASGLSAGRFILGSPGPKIPHVIHHPGGDVFRSFMHRGRCVFIHPKVY